MKKMHALAAAGLAAALVVACAGASAQDGAGPAGPAPRRGPMRGAPRADAPREVDPEVDAWAKTLAARLTDGNPVIRRSVHMGLAALGPAALPELGRLAGSEDPAVAESAMNLIAAIKGGGPGRGERGPGARDGFGPGRGGRGGRGGPGGPEEGGQVGPGQGRGPGPGPGFGGPGGPGTRGPGPDGARGPGAMLERLDLTPEQKEKVEALHESTRKRMEAIGAQVRAGELEPDAAREAHGKIRAETHEALRGILTPEQYEKLPEPPTPGAAPRGR